MQLANPPQTTPSHSLSDLFQGELDGVARIIIHHQRVSSFRWMVLVELAIVLAFCACLCPAFMVLALLSGDLDFTDAFDMGFLERRYTNHTHLIQIKLLDKDAATLGYYEQQPKNELERDGVVSAVTQAASPHGIVVLQTLGDVVHEPVDTFYGGQPLLSLPTALDGATRRADVERSGGTVQRNDESMLIELPEKPGTKGLFNFLFGDGSQPGTRIELMPDGLTICERHKGVDTGHASMAAKDVLGIRWSPTLGTDRTAQRTPNMLTIMGKQHTIRKAIDGRFSGAALTELMVATMLDFYERNPTSEGLSHAPANARCPYCTTVFVFAADARCPNCGAPPVDLKASW